MLQTPSASIPTRSPQDHARRMRLLQQDVIPQARIPRLEIEIALGRARRFVAPRIAALPSAVLRSICRAMKLSFGRQFASQPYPIRGGLGMAHVHRPLQGQTNLAKHRPVVPEVAFAPPEHGMLNTFLCLPVPGLFTPKGTVLVAPRLHEPQKIVIRYVVIVDSELVDRDFVRPKFVVPPELIAMNAFQSQDRRTRRNINQMRLNAMRLYRGNLGYANLSVTWQPVQHVRQRLRMHQPVFDGHFQHSDQLRVPFLGPLQGVLNGMVQLIPQAPVIALDLFARLPIRRRIRRQSPIHRVNAKPNQVIECPLKGLQSESALGQQIPVKRLYMSHIEYDAVSLGNWPVIHGLLAHHAKYVVGARAGVEQSGVKVVPDADSSSESSHGVFPFSWMQLPREGCAKIQRWVARWIKMVAPRFAAVNRNEYETGAFRYEYD